MRAFATFAIVAVVFAAVGAPAVNAVSVRVFDKTPDCTGESSFLLLENTKPCYNPPNSQTALEFQCTTASPVSPFTFKYYQTSPQCAGSPTATIPGTSGTCLKLGDTSSYLIDCSQEPPLTSINTAVTFGTSDGCDTQIHCNAGSCCSFGDSAILIKCDKASTSSLWQAFFYQDSPTCHGTTNAVIAGDSATCAIIGNYSVDCTGGGMPLPRRPELPIAFHLNLNVSADFPGNPITQHALGTMDVIPGSGVVDIKYGKENPSSGCVSGPDGKINSYQFNSILKTCHPTCIDGVDCAGASHDDDDGSCGCSPLNLFALIPFADYMGPCPGVTNPSSTYWRATAPEDPSGNVLFYCFIADEPKFFMYMRGPKAETLDMSTIPRELRALAVAAGKGSGDDDDDNTAPVMARYDVLNFSDTPNSAAFTVPDYCECH